jgi:hypothetical protein
MAHFEIWYAVQAGGKYVHFNKNKGTLEQIEVFYEDFEKIVELAVSLVSVPSEPIDYVALIEDAAISSIMNFALANHLYEDQSRLFQVILTPITRCQKCGIANIGGVFHWSYKNQPATPEAVLAKVCIPTAGHGDRQYIPCLAKQLHESDLGLLQKSPAEMQDFVRANNNAIEFELPDEKYYLNMARKLLGDRPDEQP